MRLLKIKLVCSFRKHSLYKNLQYGHTPFYYRTHGKRLNMRTLKDNAVINQLISGQLNRPLLQGKNE